MLAAFGLDRLRRAPPPGRFPAASASAWPWPPASPRVPGRSCSTSPRAASDSRQHGARRRGIAPGGRRRASPVALVTHDYEFLCAVCDEAAEVEGGRMSSARYALDDAVHAARVRARFGL